MKIWYDDLPSPTPTLPPVLLQLVPRNLLGGGGTVGGGRLDCSEGGVSKYWRV